MSAVFSTEQLLLNYLEICCRCPAHKTAPQATAATTDRVAEKVRERQNNAEQLQDAVTLPMDARALRPCEAQKLLLYRLIFRVSRSYGAEAHQRP